MVLGGVVNDELVSELTASASTGLPARELRYVTCSYRNAQYFQKREQCPLRGDVLFALSGHASNCENICAFP